MEARRCPCPPDEYQAYGDACQQRGYQPRRRSGESQSRYAIRSSRSVGELHITFALYERIVDVCGWPR